MVLFILTALIGLCHLGPVYSLPHVPRSDVEMVSVNATSLDKSELSTSQVGINRMLTTLGQTTVYLELACGRATDVTDAISVSQAMATYLEGVADRGDLCGLDHSRPYFNLVSTDKYEANIYFTGRVPQLLSASFDW